LPLPGALLQYAQATQRGLLPHISGLAVERQSEFVMMDAATRRNLEISETLRGEASPTLLSLLDTCATSMGSRRLRHWLHHPLRDRGVLQLRQDAIGRLVDDANGRDQLHRLLQGCVDIERIGGRIALASARPRDLSGLRDTLALLPEICAQLAQWDSPLLAAAAITCTPLHATHDLLSCAIRPGTREHHPRGRCDCRRLRCRSG